MLQNNNVIYKGLASVPVARSGSIGKGVARSERVPVV